MGFFMVPSIPFRLSVLMLLFLPYFFVHFRASFHVANFPKVPGRFPTPLLSPRCGISSFVVSLRFDFPFSTTERRSGLLSYLCCSKPVLGVGTPVKFPLAHRLTPLPRFWFGTNPFRGWCVVCIISCEPGTM